MLTSDQEVEIEVPRERNGEFEPAIVPKYSKRTDFFFFFFISRYGNGMTTRDIATHIRDMYNVDVSPSLISEVTDAVMDDVNEWRRRPLEET